MSPLITAVIVIMTIIVGGLSLGNHNPPAKPKAPYGMAMDTYGNVYAPEHGQ
jgi:hypothetical protein